MVQQEILDFLVHVEYCRARLEERSNDLLLRYRLGDDVHLVHQFFIERRGTAVELVTSHRFSILVGPNSEDLNEVDLRARLLVSELDCAVSVAVEAHLDQSVGDLPVGPSVLWEKSFDGVGLEEAVRLLRENVDELCAVANPLGPLAQPR